MTKHFQENLKDFGQKNPRAAALLSFTDSGTLQVVSDAEGEPILLDIALGGDFFYHSPHSAKEEATHWAENLPLHGVDFVTVFGLGLGYGYHALQKWLAKEPKRRLIFLEDDLRVIVHFLESKDAQKLLLDPQVQIFYIEDSEEGLQVLQSLSWAAYEKNMYLTALPFYERHRNKTYEDIKARLLYETSDIHLVLDEYMGYGVSFFRNYWKNLFLLPGAYRGNKLQGAFRGIPAIVVAAGPSLSQHLDQLQHLQGKALIFSGGSSINALIDAGIVPHFGAGIDPNPLQYLRFREACGFQLPFFYRNRLLYESAKSIHGPRLYLKGGDGYNISDWFEKKLKIPGSIIGGGHSVANFILEIAYTLGCNPIILVGYDLAYGKDLERYAPGVESSYKVSQVHQSERDEPIAWKNSDGKKIHTAWKWLLEAKWIEDFVSERPRLKLINATQGGLGLKNIAHMTLQDVEEKYLLRSRDLDSLVHTAIEEAKTIACDSDTLLKYCSQIYDSLERAKVHLEKLAIACSSEGDPHTILLEAELKEEIAYRYILEVFDRCHTKLEYYRLQFAAHPAVTVQKLHALEMEHLCERYVFLKDTAVVNQLLLAQSIQELQAKGTNIGAFSPKSQVLWT